MLDNIKSIYFLKLFFSFIDDFRKLDISRYNKRLQKYLDINIIHYKMFSGKNFIFDPNGEVRVYNSLNYNFIFKGEYKNGKRNGKGKEFYENGILKFEGEYLNGKRNGKGKEYHTSSYLLFDGEYLNGKKWNGKGYDSKGNILFELKNGNGIVKSKYIYSDKIKYEIDYSNGLLNGKGKEYYYNGKLFFEGEYLNGNKWNGKLYNNTNNNFSELKNGEGYIKEYLLNSDRVIFEGEYLNGKRNGKGKEYHNNTKLKYDGYYLNGKRNGKGKEYNSNGNLIFEGDFINNFRIKGKEYVNGILEFEGEYLFNKKWNGKGYDKNGNIIYELKNGNGKIIEYDCENGIIFIGEYLNGIKWNGKGYKSNKIIYELNKGKGFINNKYNTYLNFVGECFDGKLNGIGRKLCSNGDIYEGEFKFSHELREGYGILHDNRGNIFEGEFKDNKMEGIGTYYFYNGDKYEGEFKRGIMDGYGIFYFNNGDRFEGVFKNSIIDAYGIFYSNLGFVCRGQFNNFFLRAIVLTIIYGILYYLKQLFLLITKNKARLFLIIILILGMLIN